MSYGTEDDSIDAIAKTERMIEDIHRSDGCEKALLCRKSAVKITDMLMSNELECFQGLSVDGKLLSIFWNEGSFFRMNRDGINKIDKLSAIMEIERYLWFRVREIECVRAFKGPSKEVLDANSRKIVIMNVVGKLGSKAFSTAVLKEVNEIMGTETKLDDFMHELESLQEEGRITGKETSIFDEELETPSYGTTCIRMVVTLWKVKE